MARKPRIFSDTKVYHVILRGNNKQDIFYDEEDRKVFLSKLRHYRDKLEFDVLCYCLMDNHVHLVIKEGEISISTIMKCLAQTYSYWFNRKYDRIGHLYQERFKSEPVQDKHYFLTLIRYIHNNPVKAGMVKSCADYQYSSYHEYMTKPDIINPTICFNTIDKSYFPIFHNIDNDDVCMEMKDTVFRFMTDSNALALIKELIGSDFIKKINQMDKKIRDSFIRKFRSLGMSIKQISRLTGLSSGIVSRQRILKY